MPDHFFRDLAFACSIVDELGQQYSTTQELLAAAEQLVAGEYGAKKANLLFNSDRFYEVPEQIIDVYNDQYGTNLKYI